MNLSRLIILVASSLLLLGCNTVASKTDISAPAEESTKAADRSPWLDIANNAESIDLFMTAANNIIFLEDSESYQAINNGDLMLQLFNESTDQVGRNRAATFNRLKVFNDYIGGVCGAITEGEWTLLRTRVAPDKLSGFMDFRVEVDSVNLWCSLSVERINGTFKITHLFNHYFYYGLDDLVANFIELDANPLLKFPSNRAGNKTIYSEMDKGVAAFDAYLRQASADVSLPLVRRLRLDLIDDLTDPDIKQSALSYFVVPNGMSTQFPIQQLLLDLDSPIDPAQLIKTVELAEQITGERSVLRSVVASHLMRSDQYALAKYYLQTALIAEPTNTEPYFTLFDWYLDQQDFNNAVQTLQVLVENFGYEFERDNFTDSERYTELLEQPVFNEWLPKS